MAESKPSSTAQAGREQRHDQPRKELQAQGRHGEQGMQPRQFADPLTGGPYEFMRRISEEWDRIFDRVFDDFGLGRRRSLARSPFSATAGLQEGMWTPRIEAFHKGDRFIVRAELPGLNKDDIEVNITDDAITIQGQRQQEHTDEHEGFYHSERSYGSFHRTIPLPEGVIADSADASFKSGVLEVRLQCPPNEVRRGRRIEIQESSEPDQPPR